VETFVTESRGLSFPRSYVIRRNGEILAKAVSTWALLRLDNRSFVRVSDIDFGFEPEAPLMLSDNVPLRLRISDGIDFETVGQREIYYSDVDYNLHMNNTKYPDVLANYLPDREHRRITSVVLSYLREARLGDTLSVLRATEDGETFRFRLQASDGSTVMDAQIGTKYQD
jgi:acyl-ACP thioesterase